MSPYGWIQIIVYFLVVVVLTKPLGTYLFRVFEDKRRPLSVIFGRPERLIYRICGVDESREQTAAAYTVSLLTFSMFCVLITYCIQRLQHLLPFNPQGLGQVAPDLAFNTAVSFTTNTNWQAYGGETTMSYLTQMAALTWQNFVSAAAGIAVALALSRGLVRSPASGGKDTVGNFWVDLTRSIIYVLLPLSIIGSLVFVSQGVIQNLSAYKGITTLEGIKQTIAMGPVASQEVIKELGTNGGGFFNVNSAHPFENPTPFTNFLQMLLIFAIPAALTYTYGKMAKDQKEGWVIFAAMAVLFLSGAMVAYWAESHPNPALAGLPLDHGAGNMEGKEVRFGTAGSALFATITTAASCGAVNAMHDSFTPLGGLVPLINIMLGEVVFGGVGAGLYGMLVFVVIAVFIAGLMVGRTPEYLGKKIEAREIKYSMIYALIFPLLILTFAAWSAVVSYGLSPLGNHGPHGLTELLYAFSSGAGNNGSAFAGINAGTPWLNITMGIVMFAGRFFMIIPVLAIAGSMAAKKAIPPGPGTFPTNGILFAILLVGVVIIVGALTFFPALTLGPIVEHFIGQAGRLF
ncbi:MAG: Potassium-transporting ATPase A chain [Syntrophorhabdus sp. PtaU1.Bin058]|nr:MAG: Potassium-transporting ATPase A chain [Syntrophorhabdus sp. PtaU1.Bin058]